MWTDHQNRQLRMFGLAVVFDTLPWYFAGPLLYLSILAAGMALDETYVNRTTVLAGALGLAIHSYASGGLWLPVGLYLDLGLVVGAYGFYAYVVDAYVPDWFRVAAYFGYSPLAVALVIVAPDLLFPVALAVAAYVNLQLLSYFHPVEPYYFGPADREGFEAAAEAAGRPEPRETEGPVGAAVRPTEDEGPPSEVARDVAGPITRGDRDDSTGRGTDADGPLSGLGRGS